MGDAYTSSSDWLNACTDYLLRASIRSARVLDLHAQLLGCVGRGRIAPQRLQGSMTRQLETLGPAHAARAGELVARWREQLGALAGVPAVEEDAAALMGWVARPLDLSLERAARHWFELLDGLGAAEADLLAGLLSAALDAVGPADLDDPGAVILAAASGATASAVVSLTNTRDARARLRCTVGDVRRADGVGPAFVPRVEIAPARLDLAPGQADDVRLSLRLDADVYVAGSPYLGTLCVSRRGEAPLDLPLQIAVTAPPEGRP